MSLCEGGGDASCCDDLRADRGGGCRGRGHSLDVGVLDQRQPLPRSDGPAGAAQATFGNGCFWCTEAIFKEVKGVRTVVSGYSGGTVPDPTYEQVCTGSTGHAEAIHITYDPEVVGYVELLEVFWKTHDPTTPNRQGNDYGTQYRSVVFYHDDEQRRLAEDTSASSTTPARSRRRS